MPGPLGKTATSMYLLIWKPSGSVDVNLASSDTGEATVSPATLTFTEDNWNTARTVTVTGVNDSDRDRHQDYNISLTAADQFIENPEVSTFAGSGCSGSTDATGTSAKFYYPRAITTDGTNLYVVDTNNHTIRKIVISKVVTAPVEITILRIV
jgi:hypothetical protein